MHLKKNPVFNSLSGYQTGAMRLWARNRHTFWWAKLTYIFRQKWAINLKIFIIKIWISNLLVRIQKPFCDSKNRELHTLACICLWIISHFEYILYSQTHILHCIMYIHEFVHYVLWIIHKYRYHPLHILPVSPDQMSYTLSNTHTLTIPSATKYAVHTNNTACCGLYLDFPLFLDSFSMWNGRTNSKFKSPYLVQIYWTNCVRYFCILYTYHTRRVFIFNILYILWKCYILVLCSHTQYIQ